MYFPTVMTFFSATSWDISVWILAFLLNIITFVLHSKNTKETEKNTLPLNYLALIDCMCGIYLIIIASADRFYHKNYVGYELSWRTNFICKISSFLALIYMMVFSVILCIMMLVRYCIIQWPMTSKFKNNQICQETCWNFSHLCNIPLCYSYFWYFWYS